MAYRNLPEMPCGPILELHGQRKRFHVPFGLKRLLEDMTREVLRFQPANIYEFLAVFMEARLQKRLQLEESDKERKSLAAKSFLQPEDLMDFLNTIHTPLEEAEKHATVIQAAFRGYQTRKQLKAEKEKRKTRKSHAQVTDITAENATEEEVKAATTLQAAFRGMHVRINMKKQRGSHTSEGAERKSKKSSSKSHKSSTDDPRSSTAKSTSSKKSIDQKKSIVSDAEEYDYFEETSGESGQEEEVDLLDAIIQAEGEAEYVPEEAENVPEEAQEMESESEQE